MKFRPLPALDGQPGVQYTLGTDRSRVRPDDHSIEYSLNSDRYRCAEWEDLAWDSATWLFGDSFAIGIGVAQQHSIADLIAASTGCDVVNVAQGGSSIRYQVDQLHNMLAQGLRPARVAVIWPDPQRWPWWGSQDTLGQARQDFMHRAHTACDTYMRSRAHHDIQDFRNVMELLSVPWAELTWSTETQAAIAPPRSCPRPEDWTYCQIDQGRDLQHPGRRSHWVAHKEIQDQWATFK
jgi:hypothetical protein